MSATKGTKDATAAEVRPKAAPSEIERAIAAAITPVMSRLSAIDRSIRIIEKEMELVRETTDGTARVVSNVDRHVIETLLPSTTDVSYNTDRILEIGNQVEDVRVTQRGFVNRIGAKMEFIEQEMTSMRGRLKHMYTDHRKMGARLGKIRKAGRKAARDVRKYSAAATAAAASARRALPSAWAADAARAIVALTGDSGEDIGQSSNSFSEAYDSNDNSESD
jgi:hypothetical protein